MKHFVYYLFGSAVMVLIPALSIVKNMDHDGEIDVSHFTSAAIHK